MQEQVNYQNSPPPYNTPPETTPPTWGYTPQPSQSLAYDRASSTGFSQSLPSIHSFERTPTAVSGSSTLEPWQNEGNANVTVPAYRAWPTDSTYSTVEPATPSAHASPAYNTAPLDSPIRSSQLPRQGNSWSHTPVPAVSETPAQNRYGQDSFPVSAPPPPPFDDTVYASTPYTQHSSPHASYYPNSNYVNSPPPPPPPAPSTNPPNPRQSYTRTLVGPLSANACRLKDEHRKPGIFFLFQDLSVRTEGAQSLTAILQSLILIFFSGTFRLRLRLMNVGV
jgi:Velvet factor